MQRSRSRRDVRSSAAAAVVLAAACIAAALFPSGARAEDASVQIDDFAFAPQTLAIKAGTTVTWRNKDDIPHTVASSTRLFKSKALDTDDSYSFTFNEAGSYPYFCSLHPHMTGTIRVEPATNAAK